MSNRWNFGDIYRANREKADIFVKDIKKRLNIVASGEYAMSVSVDHQNICVIKAVGGLLLRVVIF